MANQTDVLKPYKPTNFPSDPASEARYLPEQDRQIAVCLVQIIEVMKQLETRMNAAGI